MMKSKSISLLVLLVFSLSSFSIACAGGSEDDQGTYNHSDDAGTGGEGDTGGNGEDGGGTGSNDAGTGNNDAGTGGNDEEDGGTGGNGEDDTGGGEVVDGDTVMGLADDHSEFSIFINALKQTPLAGELRGDGPFTVFAPTNQALTDAGFDAGNIDDLAGFLAGYIVGGAFDVQSASSRGAVTVETVRNGGSVAIVLDNEFDGLVYFNAIALASNWKDERSNGVVYKLNGMFEAHGNALEVAAEMGLDTFVALVNHAGLASRLQSSPNMTVFAPSDEYFQSAGITTAMTPGAVAELLKRHIVETPMAMQEMSATEYTTLGGEVVTATAFYPPMIDNVFPTYGGFYLGQYNKIAHNAIVHRLSGVVND